ncbi:MAG: translocation/assembly module TamB [Bacteroidales bacterium]|nr:translocation/assembly module TamB [Bacteroidales bacterium]
MARVLGGTVVLALLCSMLLFLPSVQNGILERITSGLSEKFDGKIEFGSVRVVPFNTAVITDALILDDHPFNDRQDTLGYVRKLKATFTLRGLVSKKGIELSRVDIDGGWFNLVTEPAGEGRTSNLQRVFGLKKKESLPDQAPDIFRFKRVKIRNFRYTMRNFYKTDYEYRGIGIDWSDLDLTADIDIHNMAFSDLVMSGVVDRLDAVEKCGYTLTDCSGDARVGRGNVTVKDLRIKDGLSDLDLPLYSMSFKNSREFSDFLNKVTLKGDFNESVFALRTVSYFSGALADNPCVFEIGSGSVAGTVSDFIATGLKFKESSSGVTGDLDCHISGIPDMGRARFNLETRDLGFNARSLTGIIDAFAGPGTFKPGKIGGNVNFNLRCKVNGTINDLSADAIVKSTAGNATAHAVLKNMADSRHTTAITARVNTNNLDLGRITGIKEIGNCNIVAGASAELIPGNPRITVDSLRAGSITLLGHEYHGIYGKGGYGKMGPYGTLIIDDPSLRMVASGERMRYTFSVPEIDLKALAIDTREGVSAASFNAGLNFYKDHCELGLYGLKLKDDSGIHDLGNIRADAFRDAQAQRITINSAFATAKAEFSAGVASFIKDIQSATTRRELDVLYKDKTEERTASDCSISFDVTDAGALLAFLIPDLSLRGNTALDLDIKDGLLTGRVISENVAYKNISLRNFAALADNAGDRLNLSLGSSDIHLGGISLNTAGISAMANDNAFSVCAEYSGSADSLNRGKLRVDGKLFRREDDSLAVTARITDSGILLAGTRWDITPATIEYGSGSLSVDNLSINSEGQSIEAKGGISRDFKDRFSLKINNVGLGLLNEFLDLPAEIGGSLDGGAILLSPVNEKLQLAMNVRSDSLSLSGRNAGSLMAGSAWDDERQRLNIMLQNFNGKKKTLDVKASYAPSSKEILATADLQEFGIEAASPLLENLFSRMGGSISGKINCQGYPDSLSIFSEGTRLQDVILRPAYTGVTYTLNGLFSVDKEKVSLDSLAIRDVYGGKATVSGTINGFLRNPELYANLRMNALRVLDVDESDAESLYGNLAVSGDALATGHFDNLYVDGNISTSGTGDIHIPLNSAMTQTRKELLTFVTREEDGFDQPGNGIVNQKEKAPKGNLTARARVRISPDVTAYADIDKSSGNMISAFGDGDLELDLNLARNYFQINGDYQLRGGSYRFAIPGIIGKDLSISDGSSVKFSGDVMDTQIDINTVYSLKTSIAPLTTDTSSVSTRRLVNCTLSITDRLRNPNIGFGIDIPDLDPMTKAEVQTALNTEEKIQRQFVSLLLLNSFLPSESSGIVNANSNMLYANVAEMMSGQFNSILQKLEIPLDLGFGYQVGDAGTDIFDVAVSTQLFNNRVIVGGSVGNRKYSTSTSANGDVVGDLDIEVKIDRSGQLRFKLFSHSADEFTSFLDYSQRNGLGVTYQREFGRKAPSGSDGKEKMKTLIIDE